MSTDREILEQSIRDHKKAIEEAERKLKETEITYSVGDRFMWGGEKYILAAGRPEEHGACLVSLKDGFALRSAKAVNCYSKITRDEFRTMTGKYRLFTRYFNYQTQA